MTLVQFSLIPVFSTGRGGCIEMPSDGYASTDRSMEWVHGRCIIFICYLLFFFSFSTLCLHLRRAIQPFSFSFHFLPFFILDFVSGLALFFRFRFPPFALSRNLNLRTFVIHIFFLVFLFLLTMSGFCKKKKIPFHFV